MFVRKGDQVRLICGTTGEVINIWGLARNYVSIKRDSDGRISPHFETEVAEILKRSSRRGRR